MTRGSYSTARSGTQIDLGQGNPGFEPRIYRYETYGTVHSSRIIPLDFPTVTLAASLSDAWLQVSREVPSCSLELGGAIRSFLRSFAFQLQGSEPVANFDLPDLRVRHLDFWEKQLSDRVAHSENRGYRLAIPLFVLLRRIDADRPGLLHPAVVRRLERPTRLMKHRRVADSPFTPNEVKKMRAAAHRCVHRACQGGPPKQGPDSQTLVALLVLLSLATGEPPEVLRRLKLADIVVSDARGMTEPDDSALEIGSLDNEDRIAVTFTKMRSHETCEVVYGRRDKAAFDAFANLFLLIQPLLDADTDALWRVQEDTAVREVDWRRSSLSLREWFSSNGLTVEPPYRWSRLRKTVTTREAIHNPSYLRDGRRHTADTFFKHYAEDPQLRSHFARRLVSSLEEKFDLAVDGPTVISVADEAEIRRGGCSDLDDETAESLINGELEGPHTACRDPLASPYEQPGKTCSRALTGLCFACPNALITKDHLPAVLVFAELTDPNRSASPRQWLQHWKPVHEAIVHRILPAFSAELVAAAEKLMESVPLALGTMNDMRGEHGRKEHT